MRLLAGALGALILGAAAGFGVSAVTGETGTLPATAVDFTRCPGDGQAIGAFHRGDRLFAVAIDSTGSWVGVRNATALGDLVWVEAAYFVSDGPLTALPKADCPRAVPLEDTTTTTPTTVPGATTTTTLVSTTIADTTPPVIVSITADPAEIYEEYAGGASVCVTQTTAAITVVTTGGATAVTLAFTLFDDSRVVVATSSAGGWSATLGPYAYGELPVPAEGSVVMVTATARDAAGNETASATIVPLRSAAGCLG